MTKVLTTTSGENFTHRILWISAERHLECANSLEKGGWYFALTAMMMSFFTYEAYLNFLGTRIDPKTWANERKFFNKRPYLGTKGKAKKIIECLAIDIPNDISLAFASVNNLSRIRDSIAHGKPDKFEIRKKHTSNYEPARIRPWLDNMVSLENANKALINTKLIINFMHDHAIKKYGAETVEPTALSGLTAIAIGTTRLSP